MDVWSSPSYTASVRPKKLECPSFDDSEVTPFSFRTDFFYYQLIECREPDISLSDFRKKIMKPFSHKDMLIEHHNYNV